ncbi:GIY-YIG nuclease family protein [Streptomyces sp. NPDC047971]|uniref:GIY-YIG nuclease family protein n=1 Tax=Streptomyces sp. NPDC047971 TaxID=3154499 RepID=UPI0033F978E5
MSDPTPRCLATDAGEPCDDVVTSTAPIALCQRHRMQVAISVVPEMLLAAAKQDYRTPRAVPPQMQAVIHGSGRAPMVLDTSHPSCVYFLGRSDRIKIGLTTNLGQRLAVLHAGAADVHLLLFGQRRLEAALHEHFADFRIANSEWFERVPALEEFIHAKRRLPIPMTTEATTGVRRTIPYVSARNIVDVGAEALLEMATRAAKDGEGVHMATIVEAFRAEGVAAQWSLAELGRAYEQAGIRVRTIRIGNRISIGIHRDDLRELSA